MIVNEAALSKLLMWLWPKKIAASFYIQRHEAYNTITMRLKQEEIIMNIPVIRRPPLTAEETKTKSGPLQIPITLGHVANALTLARNQIMAGIAVSETATPLAAPATPPAPTSTVVSA